MKLNKIFLISISILILLLSISAISANDLEDLNLTSDSPSIEISADENNNLLLKSDIDDSKIGTGENEIIVEDWNDLQYYCSLNDADYTLRLKENTNYYPDDVSDSNYQIIVNNNVKIIGNSGAYFGDASPNAGNITYTAIKVNDNTGIGITLENVTFKWIGTRYQPDGVFLQMGGNGTNYIRNCYFTNCSTNLGHSSIVYLKRGYATLENCTFINCTTDFGCVSIYDPDDDPTGTCTGATMQVIDCYFEGNYARTEPGCINNCGILVVTNSTFYKNSAFWWAGAIHTHGGANTTIYYSDFIDNLAGWNGGALYTYSYLQIYSSRFIGNNCTTNNGGGAIGACKYLHAPYIYIVDTLFENNENLCWGLDELSTSGTGRGGAISLMDEGGLEVYNSTFIKNSASIGTAICAINGGLTFGSPDVRIIGNQFINHTRVGDVLDVRVATGSVAEIRDNYYYNNSLEYQKLKLTADDPVDGIVTFHLDAALKNPSSFDADILDKSLYDVYVNGVYETTVSGRTFDLNIGKGNTVNVYVIPSISDSKSNEVSAGIAKTFIYVSKNSGNDNNNGLTRNKAVKTLAKAIQLANTTENIVIMDGAFTETDLVIDYNLTIVGEGNSAITVTGNAFTIIDGDVKFENVTFKNCKYGSSTKARLINQTSAGFLILEGCTFENNEYKSHIDAEGIVEGENLVFTNNKDGSFIRSNSISLKSSLFTNNIVTYSLYKSLLMYKTQTNKFEVEGLTFINNTVYSGCIGLKKNKATITDCTFIGNKQVSGKGSAIILEDSCSVLIESSKFINNTDTGKYSSVIYLSSGTLVVRDSIFLNNSYENSNNLVINGGETHLKKLNANNNWWGNTPDNLTKPALKVFGVSNQLPNGWDPASYWLVLNASALSNEVELNQTIPVQFSFTQIDNEGNVTYYDGVNLPSFDLDLTAVNGSCLSNKITVENGMATTYYTLTDMGGGSLTGSFNGINVTIDFTFKKSTPTLSIEANDISVGSNARIVVTVDSGVTGSIRLKVGNVTQTKTISNSRAVFSISNLAAGTYNIEANYTGNERYESNIETATFTVNKLNSTTQISVGDIALGSDVIINVTVPSDATGTIDVYVNGNKNTINVMDTYTIKKIARGDYLIRAVYNGDSKYLPSEDEYSFEVGKLNPYLSATVANIVYGQDTVVNVTLKAAATGNVTVTIDGKSSSSEVNGGKATVILSGIDAGNNKDVEVYYSGCNNYKNATITIKYNVAKANIDFSINSNDIMLGKDAIVEIRLPARIGGTVVISGIKSETKNVPTSGLVTLTYPDLDVGSYTVTAVYSSSNYLDATNSTTFVVNGWDEPQWAIEGGDIKNTGISPYDAHVNGEIKWNSQVSDAISGNLAIDANGNVYVVAGSSIYSFDSNGNIRWVYDSTAVDGEFSGVALSRDVVIAPKSEDTLYFINSSTGQFYGHSNIYQGSSVYAPIVDSNAIIYISSEAQDGDKYNLVIIPYKLWENGGSPTLIELGSQPVSAPVFVNDYLLVVACENGLKFVDIDSKSIVGSVSGNFSGRPIVGEGNMIYCLVGNDIAAYNSDGENLWRTHVTGGVGTSNLVLNPEMGVYCVNANGKLYQYDLIFGDEVLVSDLTVTSGLLIDNEGNIYFGTADSIYALDIDGNVLWKSYTGSEITGTPIMAADGSIYVNSANKVYNLVNATLKNSGLAVSVSDIEVGQNATITVSLDKSATGEVTIVVNGESYNMPVTSNIIEKIVSGLAIGTYTVKVSYYGDSRFKATTKSAKFNVTKFNPNLSVSVNNIQYGNDAIITVNLASDATGSVVVSVKDQNYTANVDSGIASVSVPGLKVGNYAVNAYYNGDSNYRDSTASASFKVTKANPIVSVSAPTVKYGNDAVITADLASGVNGNIRFTVEGTTYVTKISNQKASVSVSGLKAGSHTFYAAYAGSTNFNAQNISSTLTINKAAPIISISANDISFGDDEVITVQLADNVNGNVRIIVNNVTYVCKITDGIASATVSNLRAGDYSVSAKYAGSTNFNGQTKSTSFTVSKSNPIVSVSAEDIYRPSDAVISVNLRSGVNGNVRITVDNVTYVCKITDGVASVSIHGLVAGTYDVLVRYAGTSNFNAQTVRESFTVSKMDPIVSVSAEDIYRPSDAVISVNLRSGANGNVRITVDNVTYVCKITDGVASVSIHGLVAGTYDVLVRYAGTTNFNAQTVRESFTVSKMDPIVSYSANDIYRPSDAVISVNLRSGVNGNVRITVAGTTYVCKISDGVASVSIPGLAAGSYDVTITYAGTSNFNAQTISTSFNVNKYDPISSISANNISYGQDATISVDLLRGVNGNVRFILDGTTYVAKITNQKASISVPDLKKGTYEVSAVYAGTPNYNAQTISTSFIVS